MMKSKILMMVLGAAIACSAATIKDVKLACSAGGCALKFQFTSADDLPSFFQKYNAAAKTLTLGFSESKFAMGEGDYDVDAASQYVRSMRVFRENFRGMDFLKVELAVGSAISGDKNEIALDKSDFILKVSGEKEKGWILSKLYASKKKEAEKVAAEEKKAAALAAAEEKKAAEKQALLDKKAAAKAAAEEKKAAERALIEEKKRLAEEKKAAQKQALLDKKAAAEEEKRIAEEQKKLDKAIKEGGAVSALLPGIKEMTVLIGSGMEQFRLVAESPIGISRVAGPGKTGIITVALEGPQKSPVFKIGSSSLVKSVGWGANGLQIQLQSGANPVMLVQEGALILQASESSLKKDGFVFWTARPDGIYMRNWVKSSEEGRSFDKFVKGYEPGSNKIVSAAQTFHLRPVVRELIVVADETEFYYVNRRAVSFFDELSSVQIELLKQVDKERGENLQEGVAQSGSMLESLYEDRIIYSSFGRRDPFVEIKGLVEEGINIDQVELVGIIWESEVPMAILVESKNPSVSYTIKEGDKILNGKVLKITQTDVLFLIQEFGVSRRYSMGLPDKFGGQK